MAHHKSQVFFSPRLLMQISTELYVLTKAISEVWFKLLLAWEHKFKEWFLEQDLQI